MNNDELHKLKAQGATVVAGLFVAALAMVWQDKLYAANQAVASFLSANLHLPEGNASNSVVDYVAYALESSVAMLIGAQLSKVARIFALMQFFAVVMFMQVLASAKLNYLCQPITVLFVIGTSGAIGYAYRRRKLRDQRWQSQHYELVLKNKELQETRLQMVKQDEVERRMLAADLHDQVLNDLKELNQKFESYVAAPDAQTAQTIENLMQQAMSEIREVMDSLCPSALEHLGLVAAIEDCLRRGATRGDFKIRFKSNADEAALESLGVVEKSLIYRLVQESVTNICKHAEAKIVRGQVSTDQNTLEIKITDDGKGIDRAKLQGDSRGLRYMRQRADLIGATIAWHSGANGASGGAAGSGKAGDNGAGTTVEIRLGLSK